MPATKPSNTTKDTLFYDGQCPLCSKEISWLQKHQSGQLALQDIHTCTNSSTDTKADMLQNLHLQKSNGEWLIGLDATVQAWSHTPYDFLVAPLRWYAIKPIADKAYQYWATRRYQKKYACHSCSDI